jgi:hypothetical protein
VWLGEIICHRWLFEQLLVPSVRRVAREVILRSYNKNIEQAPHHYLNILDVEISTIFSKKLVNAKNEIFFDEDKKSWRVYKNVEYIIV